MSLIRTLDAEGYDDPSDQQEVPKISPEERVFSERLWKIWDWIQSRYSALPYYKVEYKGKEFFPATESVPYLEKYGDEYYEQDANLALDQDGNATNWLLKEGAFFRLVNGKKLRMFNVRKTYIEYPLKKWFWETFETKGDSRILVKKDLSVSLNCS